MISSESEVETWKALVRDLCERMDATPLPLVMRYERAAKELDISVSKLRAMIRAGTIRTVVVHKRRMVPRSELMRITTPTLPKKLVRAAPQNQPSTAAEWDAAAKSLKRRR